MPARRFPFADCPKGWFHGAYRRGVVEGSVAKPALARGESAITEFRNSAERSYAESSGQR